MEIIRDNVSAAFSTAGPVGIQMHHSPQARFAFGTQSDVVLGLGEAVKMPVSGQVIGDGFDAIRVTMHDPKSEPAACG